MDDLKSEIAQFYCENNLNAEEERMLEQIIADKKMSEIDMGGLVALRGFVYQYYVAIYYFIEMWCEQTWSAITFELFDDITAINAEKGVMRFIQVKTTREDDNNRTLTIADNLVKRKSNLNSWLDKLIMQNQNNEREDIESYQYELATNTYCTDQVTNYKENRAYDIVIDINEDNVYKKLIQEVEVKREKQPPIIHKYSEEEKGILKGKLGHFKISVYKESGIFKQTIIDKIATGLSKAKPYMDASSVIAKHIFNDLLDMLVQRTCDDSYKIGRKDLSFSRNEINELIHASTISANIRIQESMKTYNIKAIFDDVFCDIDHEIHSRWIGDFKDTILDSLRSLQECFSNEEENNPYVYNKFLGRIFDMRDDKYYTMDSSYTKSFLRSTLVQIVFMMSNLENTNIILNEGYLQFCNGKPISREAVYIAFCNMQKKKQEDDAKILVTQKTTMCPTATLINHNYYCVLSDVQEGGVEPLFPELQIKTITEDQVVENKKITQVNTNIKFINAQKQIESRINQISNSQEVLLNSRKIKEINKVVCDGILLS